MGSIPDIFDSFPRLVDVYLSNNNLTGILPKSFARSKVQNLWLNDQTSKLSGTIEILSSMTNLIKVSLAGNLFNGPIPNMSNCINLENLFLQGNQLTGVVPTSLSNLPNLSVVSLQDNFLQGPLPLFRFEVDVDLGVNTTNNFCLDYVGPCDQKVTTLLEIAEAFGYPIPLARSWQGNDPCKGWNFITCDDGSKIRTVNFTKQNFRGTISPAFGNLTDLQRLYLDGNDLTGSIPESLTTLHELEVVDVSHNNLTGNVPNFSPKVKFNAMGNDFLVPFRGNGTAPSPYSTGMTAKTSPSTPWIAGLAAASVGIFVACVVVIYKSKSLRKIMLKKTMVDRKVEGLIQSHGFMVQKRYSYSQVKKMTNSFREELGKGAFGVVYKGSLSNDRQVAVKILKESKNNEKEFNGEELKGEEFINEVASIIGTSHVNIVPFLGFCYETNKRALIYEFMPNGSLDKFINEEVCKLDGSSLYQIIIGIARGLEYLHWGCNTKILHLDIKPQNILLDEDFVPKIADFGLAKICAKKKSIVCLQYVGGTPGYIAPEVYSQIHTGVSQVSHKSDVYSYGKLILKVMGGKKNYNNKDLHTSEMYFTDWIYEELEQDNLSTRCLTDIDDENDLTKKIILVSMWCIQKNPSDRPCMKKVIEMLEGPLDSVPFPPKPES
ncbi:receptor-like kinase TMK4 [Arachis duranensis]|uniref:Receptor-like kinase TMK4 n=1 Tax=Arachis duranensis TaxID=130453 RepID=A0A6P4D826_ARADU|nr:receptor-like kinase TMK4 [Arachis duranensis]